MNEKPTIEVGKVPIITKFIYTLGVLPTSYLMTMTYQEQVTWLYNYIQSTLIPQINVDVEAIQELQNLYELLRTYVNSSIEEFETSVNNKVQSLEDFMNNYFNNLDVQEEINNKLEAMAESGQLTDIIAQYLGLAGMITFDNVTNMKESQNLVNGSKCTTLGFYTVNDGGSALYKIRTKTNNDVIDEKTKIALYDNTLIAELIKTPEMSVKQFGAYGDSTHDDTIAINTAIKYADNINIPNGTYLIEPAKSLTDHNNGEGLKIPSNKIINLDENAILQCKTNNYDAYQVVTIDNASNVTIKGGHIYGDKLTHTGSSSSEFGCVLYIYSSSNVNIENCEVAYGFGDSITIGAINYGNDPLNNCKNVKIKDCELHNSRRQGISVISAERTTIKDCYIHDISGISPQSGIDIESNYPDDNPVKICYIDSCKFNNNGSADIIVTSKSEDVNITNCTTNSSLIVSSSGDNVKISNCNINQGLLCGSDIETLVDHCVFKNVPVQNISLNSKFIITNSLINTYYLTYPTTAGDTYATFKNCTFDHDIGSATSSQPAYYLFYTRQNTNLIVDSCNINSNGAISATPAKSVYVINNDITCATDSNGFNSVKATLLNNTINSKFYRLCSLNTSSNDNFIINNVFNVNPASVISGDLTGKCIIANNISNSALSLATNSTNVYANNNYYPQ